MGGILSKTDEQQQVIFNAWGNIHWNKLTNIVYCFPLFFWYWQVKHSVTFCKESAHVMLFWEDTLRERVLPAVTDSSWHSVKFSKLGKLKPKENPVICLLISIYASLVHRGDKSEIHWCSDFPPQLPGFPPKLKISMYKLK